MGSAPEALLAALQPLSPADRTGMLASESFTCVQALRRNTSESCHERPPAVCPESGNAMVSWLRLDNRAELSVALGIPADRASRMSDPDLVLAAYQRWGTATADRLEGDFAFVIWDPRRRQVYAARDAMGVRPLYFAATRDLFAFGTTVAGFRPLSGVDDSPCERWLAYSVAGHASGAAPDTALTGVSELPPAHWLLADGEHLRTQRYHEFRDDSPRSTRHSERWVRDYRVMLDEAVRSRMRSAWPLAGENSGGLDSGSILALTGSLGGMGAVPVTFGRADFTGDEARMRLIAGVTGTRHVTLPALSSREWFEQGSLLVRVLGHPPEIGNTVGCWTFARCAQAAGARTMFSGHGGDHAVTHHARDLVVRELLLRRHWAAAYRYQSGSPLRRAAAVWRRSRRERSRPGANAFVSSFLRRDLVAVPLHSGVVSGLGIDRYVAHLGRWAAPYDSVNPFVVEHRLSHIMRRRGAEMNQVAHSLGIEYRYPLLDRRLIQQYLSTPSIEKASPEYDRFLHRRAVADVVPAAIAWSSAKNAGEPLAAAEPALSPDEVVQRALVLRRELHPTLAGLVDPERIAVPPTQSVDDRAFMAWCGSVDRLSDLDRWLKARG